MLTFIRSGGGGGGDSLIRAGTDVWAQTFGISGVNLCPGIRSWEVNFAQALGNFCQKKCVIVDKRVKKVIYLLKIFNFGTLKLMKTCLVIRFLAVICPGIRFFREILPGLGFALATHPYLPLLGSRPPPPPPHSSSCYMNVGQKYMYLQTQHASIAT